MDVRTLDRLVMKEMVKKKKITANIHVLNPKKVNVKSFKSCCIILKILCSDGIERNGVGYL